MEQGYAFCYFSVFGILGLVSLTTSSFSNKYLSRNVMFDIPAPAVSVTVRHVTTPLVVVQLYRTLGRIPSLEDGPIHQSVLPVAVLVLVAANAESRREKDKLFGCK